MGSLCELLIVRRASISDYHTPTDDEKRCLREMKAMNDDIGEREDV